MEANCRTLAEIKRMIVAKVRAVESRRIASVRCEGGIEERCHVKRSVLLEIKKNIVSSVVGGIHIQRKREAVSGGINMV